MSDEQRLALEVELLEVETAVALLAAGIPPGTRRAPLPHEVRARIDLATIQARLDHTSGELGALLVDARNDLLSVVAVWLAQSVSSPSDVASRVESLVLVARMPPGVRQVLDQLSGQVRLRLSDVAEAARFDTEQEAEQDGVGYGQTDRTAIDDAVDVATDRLTATPWLAILSGLRAESARNPWNQPGMTAGRLVDELVAAARDSSERGLLDQATQAVNAAQGAGRMAGLEAWDVTGGEGFEAYASEILDPRVCGPCADVDGKRYRTLAEALVDYPAGQYRDCAGGARCRGQLVVVVNPSSPDSPAMPV